MRGNKINFPGTISEHSLTIEVCKIDFHVKKEKRKARRGKGAGGLHG